MEKQEEMSTMAGGNIVGSVADEEKETLSEVIDELLNEIAYDMIEEDRKQRKYIDKVLIEKQEDQEFSKYFGINVQNHEVLTQIKDDIHMKTMSQGDDETFVEYFKRYVFLYVQDLIQTDQDIVEIENEIEQIKGVLNEVLILEKIQLQVDPKNPGPSPIDNELFGVTGEDGEEIEPEEDPEQYLNTPTSELEAGDVRGKKRQTMELDDGGQQDAKKQAIDLMNNIDDIILSGYEKISDDLNRELYVRYLIINIMLHIDKAYNQMRDDVPDVDIEGYSSEEEINQGM